MNRMSATHEEIIEMVRKALDTMYEIGKRAGREDMRERAERAVMDKWTAPTDTILDGDTIDACAAAIRALGVDDD